MKIGLLGGSFDPITNAHLILAETAREEFGLWRVDFIPTYQNPLKNEKIATDKQRLDMLDLALSYNVVIEDREIKNKIKNTIHTLKHYESEYSTGIFYFIMGSDAYMTFNKWKDCDKILKRANLLVANRIGMPCLKPSIDSNVKTFDLPFGGISSTNVRDRVKAGKSIKYLVPESVEHYIYANNLYRS